jgi:NhaP-type Na+/H+ or K+/H+ antiporter
LRDVIAETAIEVLWVLGGAAVTGLVAAAVAYWTLREARESGEEGRDGGAGDQ